MKALVIIIAGILISIIFTLKSFGVNENYAELEYLPSIEASLEIESTEVNDLESGSILLIPELKIETETETEMKVESWMKCNDVWNVN